MTIDLYKDDLASATDSDVYSSIEEFTGMRLPLADRPQEGYLLDFKAAWSDSALKTVAAFANTFGGLLLIGVSEKDGRPEQLQGVEMSRQELKTTIASSIASNISPTPSYEVREMGIPQATGYRLCVVRVRKGDRLYLLTKKGEPPVYIRNEDESRAADAARLQALLAIKQTSAQLSFSAEPAIQTLPMNSHNLYITRAPRNGEPQQRTRSDTFLTAYLFPSEPQIVHLDLAIEQRLHSIIREAYPELANHADERPIGQKPTFSEIHRRDWYQINYSDELIDHEMEWAIDSGGALYFIVQIRCRDELNQPGQEVWSLADLMTNLDRIIGIAHTFWDSLNYPGEAQLHAGLHVESLPLLERSGGGQTVHASAFYAKSTSRARAKPLSADALIKPSARGARGTGMVELTYSDRHSSHAFPVGLLTNQLLRELGYTVNLTDLTSLL